jgi:proton-dependent oligopeptide transporter, POT family
MSLWFLSDAAAQGVSAQLVPIYPGRTELAYFAVVGSVVVLAGVAVYLAAPAISARMQGVR